jgi:MoaA/NifB/PqqE/SkfB family radical SAM enzyme
VEFLQIEPTTRCNFTCGFCCGRAMPQEDLAWSTFEAALATFPDLKHVELQGEGESLLHADFAKMVEVLRARQIQVSLITNGSLWNPAITDRLLGLGIQKVAVSIESADPETFKKLRGGKLEKVIRNLEHLMAERSRRGLRQPVVGFSVTVLRSTRAGLADVYALYERLGLDGGITLQPLQAMTVYTDTYRADLAGEGLNEDDGDRVIARFFSDAELRRIQTARPPERGFYEQMMAAWKPGTGRCPYLDAGMYVHRDGAVTACCMIKDTARHGLGRVGETPLAELLAGRDRLAAELASGVTPEACRGCTLARFAVMGRFGLLRFAWRGLVDRVLGHP